MAAVISTVELQSSAISPPPGRPHYAFTVDQYHAMISAGILTEQDKVELLEGWILEMTPIGPPHYYVVDNTATRLNAILPAGFHASSGRPLTLSTSEPEPDVSVVRGLRSAYRTRHPRPSDVLLVIEVSYSSLDFDRRHKSRIYAEAGIPEYWILNLVDGQAEVYRAPRPASDLGPAEYTDRQVVAMGDLLGVTLDGVKVGELRVSDLLS